MKYITKFCVMAALLQFLLIPFSAFAGDQVPTEKEIMQAGNEPPLIPHPVSDAATARDCLKCHETGKKGAPAVSHPERKNCTQCHIPAKVKAKGGKKGKKNQ